MFDPREEENLQKVSDRYEEKKQQRLTEASH